MRFLNKLKNINVTKDSKVLLENFASLTLLQGANILLPLITLPYLIRVLGFTKYGLIALAASLIMYFVPIMDYGFKITGTRDVAIFKSNPIKVNIIYSRLMTIKFIFLIISLCIFFIVVLAYPPFFEEKGFFFLFSLSLIGQFLFPEWFFQGIEKMKYITILSFLIKLLFTISVFVFIHQEADYWKYPLLQGLGFIIMGLLGQYVLLGRYKLKFYVLKKKTLVEALKANFPIFINQFAPTMYNNTNTFLLGVLVNTGLVGVYDAIKKVTDIAVFLIGILSRVFFPFLNRKKNAFPRFSKLILTSGIVLSLLPILFHDIIFLYLNVEQDYAFLVLCLLSLSTFGYTLYSCYGLNFFIVKREDKLVMRNTIFSSLIAFLLAFPLIGYFGIIGAALNLLMARFLMGGYLYVKWRNYDEA